MKRPGNTLHWEDVYQQLEIEEMPWFSPKLDNDIEKALLEYDISGGPAIDVGTGPGTQAIALAKLGFKVTGIDVSETAIRKARIRASEEEVKVTFVQDDILNSSIKKQFNLAIDRGCFHVVSPPRRADYVLTIHSLLKPNGYLFLKCFSHKEPPGPGPYRLTAGEIRELFRKLFKVRSISDSNFKGVMPHFPKALFCVIQKRAQNKS